MKLDNIEEYLKDIRTTRVIHNFLFGRNSRSWNSSRAPSFKEMQFEIKKTLFSYDEKSREQKISNAINSVKNKLLDDQFFSWIDSNEKIIFAWGNIFFENKRDINSKKQTLPITAEIMKQCFINYFDDFNESLPLKEEKLDKIKSSWKEFEYTFKNPFKWLDKDDYEQCVWAWNYTREHMEISDKFIPDNKHEFYCYILLFFYFTNHSLMVKKAFLTNIRKSNSQLKYRKSIKDKVVLNAYIDATSKKTLDEIAKTNKLSIRETIEKLIYDENIRMK